MTNIVEDLEVFQKLAVYL